MWKILFTIHFIHPSIVVSAFCPHSNRWKLLGCSGVIAVDLENWFQSRILYRAGIKAVRLHNFLVSSWQQCIFACRIDMIVWCSRWYSIFRGVALVDHCIAITFACPRISNDLCNVEIAIVTRVILRAPLHPVACCAEDCFKLFSLCYWENGAGLYAI